VQVFPSGEDLAIPLDHGGRSDDVGKLSTNVRVGPISRWNGTCNHENMAVMLKSPNRVRPIDGGVGDASRSKSGPLERSSTGVRALDQSADECTDVDVLEDTERFSREERFIGARAGRFVLEEKIGAGGMGTVYRARHVDLGNFAAVKIMFDRAEGRVSRFLAEGKTLARLHHPNLIKIFDVGQSSELGNFIVMELLQGLSLEEQLRSGPLLEPRAVALMLQVVGALRAAHAQRIIHRDIKPANLFLEPHVGGEHVKLLDFGIAKSEELSCTTTSSIVGTPRYMSPEQWMATSVDYRSDIYTLGIVFYEMVTGRLPYAEATTIPALALAVMTPLVPLPSQVNPAISKGVEQVILRMTQIRPEDRYQTVDELLRDLQALTPVASGDAKQMVLPRANHSAWMIATMMLVVGVGAAIFGVTQASAQGRSSDKQVQPAVTATASERFTIQAAPMPSSTEAPPAIVYASASTTPPKPQLRKTTPASRAASRATLTAKPKENGRTEQADLLNF
jgi:serine/threonine protein kinase